MCVCSLVWHIVDFEGRARNAPPDRRAADHRAAISAHCRSDRQARVAALAAELAATCPRRGRRSPGARALVAVRPAWRRRGRPGVDKPDARADHAQAREASPWVCPGPEACPRPRHRHSRAAGPRPRSPGRLARPPGASHSLFVNATYLGLMLHRQVGGHPQRAHPRRQPSPNSSPGAAGRSGTGWWEFAMGLTGPAVRDGRDHRHRPQSAAKIRQATPPSTCSARPPPPRRCREHTSAWGRCSAIRAAGASAGRG